MAWLSVTPKDMNISRERLAKLNKNDKVLELPDLECFDYMIGYLKDLGFIDSQSNGLSFTEIKNWCDLTGVDLDAWESQTLKELSSIFAIEFSKKSIEEPYPK